MEIKNYRKEDLFICYSIHLFYYLKLNGFRYLYRDYNPKTNKATWLFERSHKLLEVVTAYSNNNK